MSSTLVSLPSSYKKVTLKEFARGLPTPANFVTVEAAVPTFDSLKENEIFVRVLYLSVDPYMRGRIGGDIKRASRQPIGLGDVIPGATIGEIVYSKSSKYKQGDVVHCYSGWVEYYVLDGTSPFVTRCFTELGLPLPLYLGALGMTGLTAYYGMTFVCEPKKTDTVVVSGAAGAVGMLAAQIGKIRGARVIGIAGSNEKCEFMTNVLKLDGVINYKTEDVPTALANLTPNGVDVYFDNTGGTISDAVIHRINKNARIAICGQISTYNEVTGEPILGPRVLHHLLWKTAKMQGFLVGDYSEKDAETTGILSYWVQTKQLIAKEDVMEGGLDKTVEAFLKLFSGSNFGKQMVHIAPSLFNNDRAQQ